MKSPARIHPSKGREISQRHTWTPGTPAPKADHGEGGGGKAVKILLALICIPIVIPLLVVVLILISIWLTLVFVCKKRDRVLTEAVTYSQTAECLVNYANRQPPFCTTNGTDEIPPCVSSKGIASSPATNLVALMQRAAQKGGDTPALAVERPLPPMDHASHAAAPALPLREWLTWSWSQYGTECAQVARSLMHLGMQQHETVAIYGYNAPEW